MPALFELKDVPVRLTTLNNPEPILQLNAALGRVAQKLQINLPTTSGEILHWDGVVTRIPRGLVDTKFVPKIGTVNLAVVEPPVPATVPMKTVRVPKGIGVIITVDWGLFAARVIGDELTPLVEAYEVGIARLTMKQDLELAGETLAMTQVNPQASAQRLRSKCLTKTARKNPRRSHKIRAFSRR